MKTHKVLEIIAKNSPHLSWIKDNTLLLVRSGSHAYGTNVATSDEDFKGVTVPPSKYYFGFQNVFEQAELNEPDAVVYELQKFFRLAAGANPNIIEVLHTDPEDHMLVTPLGQKLLDHKNDFLSKKVKFTFSGYAIAQLKRIKNHKKWVDNPPKAPPTRQELGLPEESLIPKNQLDAAMAAVNKELDRMNFDFMEGLDVATKIEIRHNMSHLLSEMKLTSDEQFAAASRKIGFNDNLIEILQKEKQYEAAKRDWKSYLEWKEKRNPKRAADEAKFGVDLKHAYHLVRLLRMGKEILTTGKVLVKRPDREELLAIRNGAWSYEQLIEFAENADQELNELYNTENVLPHSPNKNKLDALCIEIVESLLFSKPRSA